MNLTCIQHLFIIALVLLTLASCKSKDDDMVNMVDPETNCNTVGILSPSTNNEIEALRQAILTFRNSLTSSLRDASTNCLDDDRFIVWHNTPGSRDGILYSDLTLEQLDNFKVLLQQFLSANGYQKVNEITTLAEAYLSEINAKMWHPDKYAIDMFGNPETDGSWGFQLDGHHCAINFLVHGDNISIVPAFLGAEPTTGSYNGTTFDIFNNERDLALHLYNNFTVDEISTAVSTGSSATMQLGPAPQNGDLDPYAGNYDYSGFETGLKFSEMSASTQTNLIILMKEYVYNLKLSFADVWWQNIFEHMDDTYFVWLDDIETPNSTTQFYYRIYNPYLWVEYNMENPVGAGIEPWNHAHTITRIPNNPSTENGGDYGIFAQLINNHQIQFLAQHYRGTDHHIESHVVFDYSLSNRH